MVTDKLIMKFVPDKGLEGFSDFCDIEHDYTKHGAITFKHNNYVKAARLLGISYMDMSKSNRKIFRQICIDQSMDLFHNYDALLDLVCNDSHKMNKAKLTAGGKDELV